MRVSQAVAETDVPFAKRETPGCATAAIVLLTALQRRGLDQSSLWSHDGNRCAPDEDLASLDQVDATVVVVVFDTAKLIQDRARISSERPRRIRSSSPEMSKASWAPLLKLEAGGRRAKACSELSNYDLIQPHLRHRNRR